MVDGHGRPLGDLRLSVIDQCNLRCQYCMPEERYTWLPRRELLSPAEIALLVEAFLRVGVTKVRITGGEPLIRVDLPGIIESISALLADSPAETDLAITTNGVLLAEKAAALRAAGLRRVTISLDTLRPERFSALSKRDRHGAVIEGIRAVPEAGFDNTKLDTVMMRGFNDDELIDLVEFARSVPAEVRFIEYMDVGGATTWSPDKVLSKADMLARLTEHYGYVEELPKTDAAPANRFVLPDGTTFGIISSTTEPFCATCNRSRVTADGMWFHCLYAMAGTDLRTPLRRGANVAELAGLLSEGWSRRLDRGAERRLSLRDRTAFLPAARLRQDPHLEMHTRGG